MEPMETVDQGGMFAALGATVLIIYLAFLVLMIASMWKIFTKAGRPGWAAIVPIYNIIVLLEIVGKPAWWFILLLLFPISIIFAIIVTHRLSVSFGQGIGTTLLLLFLPFIGLPMLAFGSAQYTGAVPAARPV